MSLIKYIIVHSNAMNDFPILELPFSGFATDLDVCCIPLDGTDRLVPELNHIYWHKNLYVYIQIFAMSRTE